MDFIEEPNQSENRTDETIEKLEDEIDHYYTLVENKFSQLWSKTSENEQVKELKSNLINQINKTKELNDKLHIKEQLGKIEEEISKIDLNSITTQVNSGLDLLDSKLEIVEKEASKYVSSFTSFFSNIISVTPETKVEVYGNTRYDNELLKLHTDKSFYKETNSDFNVDSKTEEITQLLKKYPKLQSLMNDTVPPLDYKSFWFNYFKNEEQLKKDEENRKKILESNEEEFSWDNDDDEVIVEKDTEVNDDDDDWE